MRFFFNCKGVITILILRDTILVVEIGMQSDYVMLSRVTGKTNLPVR